MNLSSKRLPVVIAKDQLGNAVRLTSNPKYSYVKLTQERILFDFNTGWTKSVKYTAIIKGDTETLRKLNYDKIQELPGNIVVVESTTPTNPNDIERDIKRTGKDGVILCTPDGEPIYRKCLYDPTGVQEDILVQHQSIEVDKSVPVKEEVKTEEPEALQQEEQEEEDSNQLSMFSEESTIEEEVEELLENSNEESEEEDEEENVYIQEPTQKTKVSLGSIGNNFVEQEIQEDFEDLNEEFTFDIEG